MGKVGRPNSTTNEQRREIWRRWKDGQSLGDIGRALGKIPGSVFHVVKAYGGYVPAERTRSCADHVPPIRPEFVHQHSPSQ